MIVQVPLSKPEGPRIVTVIIRTVESSSRVNFYKTITEFYRPEVVKCTGPLLKFSSVARSGPARSTFAAEI